MEHDHKDPNLRPLTMYLKKIDLDFFFSSYNVQQKCIFKHKILYVCYHYIFDLIKHSKKQ